MARVAGVACVLLLCTVATAESGQTNQSPQCTAARLAGTWERVSLLRNALSVQPPDAPLFVKFGSDGYWSMMEMPDRPAVDKPLEQQTAKELWSRFDKVEGGYGTWTIKGDVVTRKHVVNVAAGGEHSSQDRSCLFENEILALIGTSSARSPQARFRRLPVHAMKSSALVGTWERTALTIDGKVAQPPAAAQTVILGEDGWFSQTQLPAGRKPVGKPLEQFGVDDYVKTYDGVAAARGTYTVENNTLTRTHVADIDPNMVGYEERGQFTVDADTMTLRGSTRAGKTFEARFRRLKPLETTVR